MLKNNLIGKSFLKKIRKSSRDNKIIFLEHAKQLQNLKTVHN